jgi:hypothetical protein
MKDNIIKSSTHFTGDVRRFGWPYYRLLEDGRLNVVTWLVKHTVLRDNIELLSNALTAASTKDRLNVVTWLVKHTVQRDDVELLSNALTAASTNGQLKVVTWLVEHTVLRDDVRCLNVAFQCACDNHMWNIVMYLMEQGSIDVNITLHNNNRNWPTIMHKIIDYSSKKAVFDIQTVSYTTV